MEFHPEPHRTLRIACVTETFPPEVNGVALTLARLVEGLRSRQHQVQLVRPRQAADGPAGRDTDRVGQFARDVLVRGFPIPNYPDLRMGVPCKRFLVRLWRHTLPDVVHIATEGPLGHAALRAAKSLGLPVCSDFRTNFHAYSTHYGLSWLRRPIMGYLRRFHNATQCTMVPTQALRDELEAAGLRNLAVVSRGVDLKRFHPALRSEALRAQWGAGPQDLVAIYVGRLAPEKNLTTLIAAFDEIRRTRAGAKLVIVGDGPARGELEARCPGAIFAGQRAGEELAAHYASADLFVFPSLTETFGNVTTEAMASGLAVVAYDHAAAKRLIRGGVNGWIVPPGLTSAFIETVSQATSDVARCRLLGERARESVRPLDWEAVTMQFESVLFDSILRMPQRGGYMLASSARPSA